MEVKDIFSEIIAHGIKGVMTHVQLSDYYDFLNLHGYKRCHEYHAICEMKDMEHLKKYYINHYNRLIEDKPIENPAVIPASWYPYSRQDIDVPTKRSAVKSGIESWVAWEKSTKNLYEQMYTELINIGEIASAEMIAKFIHKVDKELKWATRKHIDLVTADYSISYIMGEQDHLHDWYKNKIKGKDKKDK